MKSVSTGHGDAPSGADEGTKGLIAGRYRVEALLGEGGMGAVYRARDEQQGVSVALKRLHAGSERAKVALFEQEFFTLSELAHPRIIEVYDYGIDAGRAHYTMELLDGADLRDHKKLDWQTVCALLCDVACSLGILHSRGFLHRDVSPRNVRRTADGRAKLIDFGAMARMGTSKELVGTPPCVAPEVLHGQPCDARADLYALGVVGYWLLTGRYAYPARSFAELPDVWSSQMVPVQQLSPGVPARLAELIGELISLDPADGRRSRRTPERDRRFRARGRRNVRGRLSELAEARGAGRSAFMVQGQPAGGVRGTRQGVDGRGGHRHRTHPCPERVRGGGQATGRGGRHRGRRRRRRR